MKVLLVQPPIEDFYDTSIRTYPLNLLYIAARIRDLCDVSVADLRTGRKRALDFPQTFQALAPFYRDDVYTPFSLFRKYYRFGATAEEITRIIQAEAPDVVGISASCTTYSSEALEVARIAKELHKSIITVMGGTHATLFPQHLLQDPAVDYVVRGEGETPFAHLLGSLKVGENPRSKMLNGVCFNDNGHFHISGINLEQEIDLLPDRRAISSELYRINRKKYAFFLTSRGCPFTCSFCGKPPVPYRRRSLGSVERELGDCIGLGIEAIDFEDDMLNLEKTFFVNVLRLFRDKGLTLSAMNGIYPGTVDIATLELMYAAGFRRLNFSLVDAQEKVLQSQERVFPKALLELLPWLGSSPFFVEVHFIIGLPGQEPEDLLDTIIFLMGKRLLLGPSIFYLAPGSALFREIVGDAWEPYLKQMRSSAMFPASPSFKRETTYTLMKIVRFINWVKQTVDKETGAEVLRDLVQAMPAGKPHGEEIFRRLLGEERFTWYSPKERAFRDEPQDEALVRLFFEKTRGLEIKGFKTGNVVKVDV